MINYRIKYNITDWQCLIVLTNILSAFNVPNQKVTSVGIMTVEKGNI